MFLPKIWLICRICLKQNYGMLNLYTNHCDLPIWNVLRDVGGIPVRKDDNLSDKICETCLDSLWKAYTFRLGCQRAHRHITQVVQYGGKKPSQFWPAAAVTAHRAIAGGGRKNSEFLPVNTVIANGSITQIVQYEDKNCSGFLPMDAMDVTPSLVDITRNGEVEDFKSAECNISRISDDDLKNHNSEPEAESKLNDHQCVTKVEPITNSDDNILERESSNLKCPAVVLETIDDKMQAVTKSTKQPVLNATREPTFECKTEKKAKNNPRSSPGRICCNICKNSFSSKTMLRQHMYTHIKPHICRLCGKTFSRRRHIKNHLNTHYGLRPYSCRLCPSRFADISNRNKHERSVHKRERLHNYGKPKQCFVCALQFATVSELRNHHSLHLKPEFKEDAV